MKIGVIDERGGDNRKISHILFKEIERLYDIEYDHRQLVKDIARLEKTIEKLDFMVKNGLGYEDLEDDTIPVLNIKQNKFCTCVEDGFYGVEEHTKLEKENGCYDCGKKIKNKL